NAGGLQHVLPRLGLPRQADAGLLKQVRPVVELAHVGAEAEAVDLALIAQEAPQTFGDVRPTFPIPNVWTSHLIQRLQVSGLNELGHPEAVKRHNVGAGAHAQVQRVLLLEGLVGTAKLDEPQLHLTALLPHLLLERREDGFVNPLHDVGIDATLDRASDDGHRLGKYAARHGEGQYERQRHGHPTTVHCSYYLLLWSSSYPVVLSASPRRAGYCVTGPLRRHHLPSRAPGASPQVHSSAPRREPRRPAAGRRRPTPAVPRLGAFHPAALRTRLGAPDRCGSTLPPARERDSRRAR